MPRVETYGPRKVTTAAEPAVRQQARETPASVGLPMAEALAGAGTTIVRVGQGALNIEEAELVQQRQRAYASGQVAIQNQANQLDDLTLKAFREQRGRAAYESRPSFLEQWDEQADMYVNSAPSDDLRLYAEQQRASRRASLLNSMGAHATRELEAWEDNEIEGFLTSSENRAATFADDPAAVLATITDAEQAYRAYATQRGIGEQKRDATIADIRNKGWVAAITALRAGDQIEAARAYLDHAEAAGQLTGEALTRMKLAVDQGEVKVVGEQVATDIYTEFGPKKDDDAHNLDKMTAVARERLKGRPEVLEATIAGLRARVSDRNTGIASRQDQASTALWGAVRQNRRIEDIRKLPEYGLFPKVATEVEEFVEKERIEDENRADRAADRILRAEGREATRAARQAAEESRAYTRGQREQAEAEKAALYALSRPGVLAKLSEAQILEELPNVGREGVNFLLTKRKELLTEPAIHAASMDEQAFKAHAVSAGYDWIVDPQNNEQKSIALQLQNLVEREIAGEIAANGNKDITREKKDAAMQRVLDRTVLTPGLIWGTNERPVAEVFKAEDIAQAYVPLEKIRAQAPKALERYANFLRSEYPWLQRDPRTGQPVPETEIATRFQLQIQKAYARYVLGRPNAEIEAALKER